jgi:hypothetical protein
MSIYILFVQLLKKKKMCPLLPRERGILHTSKNGDNIGQMNKNKKQTKKFHQQLQLYEKT